MKRRSAMIPTFVKREEALRIILRHARTLPAERCAIGGACGRVLTRVMRAPIDLPPFRRALMDGYAIAGGGCGREFAVGLAAAGFHAVPVERMVPNLSGVVEQRAVGLKNDLLQ